MTMAMGVIALAVLVVPVLVVPVLMDVVVPVVVRVAAYLPMRRIWRAIVVVLHLAPSGVPRRAEDPRRREGGAEAVVDVHDRDPGRARRQHPEKRREPLEGGPVAD